MEWNTWTCSCWGCDFTVWLLHKGYPSFGRRNCFLSTHLYILCKDTVPSSIDIFVDALLCDGVKHTGRVLVEDAILYCGYCIRVIHLLGEEIAFSLHTVHFVQGHSTLVHRYICGCTTVWWSETHWTCSCRGCDFIVWLLHKGYPSFGRRNFFLSTHCTFCARTQYPRP
jgi:hypothetical protein